MEILSKDAFDKLVLNTHIIEKDGYGLKVLETQDNRMIKIFRRKRFFSTALFKPYAVRFVENAEKLSRLNIPTIQVDHLYKCSEISREVVVYQKLAGELLREVFQKSQDTQNLSQQFGSFVAQLHSKGVYFRSIHLKNILVLNNGELGLIDISDMQIKQKPLSLRLCLRNFYHMLRYPEDKKIIKDHFDDFLNAYASQADLSNKQKGLVKSTLLELTN